MPLSVVSEESATVTDVEWELRARELQFNALANIRSVGERWAATIGAVTGIFATTALVKGPSDISKVRGGWRLQGVTFGRWRVFGLTLGPWHDVVAVNLSWKVTAVLLIAVAVSVAVLSIVLAAIAAQGVPRIFQFTGSELRRLSSIEASHAQELIRASRYLAVLSIPLLGAAIGIMWFRTPSEGTVLRATTSAGTTLCGVLKPAGAPGLLVLTDNLGQVTSITPLNQLAAVASATDCPTP